MWDIDCGHHHDAESVDVNCFINYLEQLTIDLPGQYYDLIVDDVDRVLETFDRLIAELGS